MNVWTEEKLDQTAREELGEETERVKADLTSLKEWLSKSPHLQNVRKDDSKLLEFLRGCKFSLERTKEKIDLYNSCRAALPDWFQHWDPSSPIFQKFLNWGNLLPLPGYDKQGRQVVLIRPGKIVPAKATMEEVAMTSLAFLELINNENKQGQIRGLLLINDLADAGPQHALMMNPVTAKKFLTIIQEAYPARPQAIHFLNLPSAMETVLNMMQSFMKDKMRKRNKIHPKGDYSSLWEEVGKDVLPVEYGGTNMDLDTIHDQWKNRVNDNRDWLMLQSRYKADESLRPGKPRSYTDIFGIEGSFRKLEID